MIFKEINADLFKMSKEYSLAHCISCDCALGKGIALEFRNRYPDMVPKLKEVIKLKNIKKSPFTIGYEAKDDRYIFNLVTKDKCYEKPTYDTLKVTLNQMKYMCNEKQIKKIAMPTIGCGLDKLQWEKVREIILDTFDDTDIEIAICRL